MEYMTAIQRKRPREAGDLDRWNLCQTKRVCDGVGSCARVEYGAVADCPMDSGDIAEHQQGPPKGRDVPPHPLPHPTTSRPPQCCPRCLAGEPGHINHIMGY